jgi:hypothetical protein
VCGLPQMCVCHIITGDKNRPVVKVLFPLHIYSLKDYSHEKTNTKNFLLVVSGA